MVCMYHLPSQWIKFDSDNIDRLKSAKGGEDRDGRSVQTCLGGMNKMCRDRINLYCKW